MTLKVTEDQYGRLL